MALNSLLLGIVMSMLPLGELRLGIPILVSGGMPAYLALIIGFLANIVVILPIWFFLDNIHDFLSNYPIYKKFSDRILERMHNKATHLKKSMEVLEWFALTLFVAIPLPVTGVYTGSIVVWILGLERKKSFIFISLGSLIAGLIVTLATLGVINFFNFG